MELKEYHTKRFEVVTDDMAVTRTSDSHGDVVYHISSIESAHSVRFRKDDCTRPVDDVMKEIAEAILMIADLV